MPMRNDIYSLMRLIEIVAKPFGMAPYGFSKEVPITSAATTCRNITITLCITALFAMTYHDLVLNFLPDMTENKFVHLAILLFQIMTNLFTCSYFALRRNHFIAAYHHQNECDELARTLGHEPNYKLLKLSYALNGFLVSMYAAANVWIISEKNDQFHTGFVVQVLGMTYHVFIKFLTLAHYFAFTMTTNHTLSIIRRTLEKLRFCADAGIAGKRLNKTMEMYSLLNRVVARANATFNFPIFCEQSVSLLHNTHIVYLFYKSEYGVWMLALWFTMNMVALCTIIIPPSVIVYQVKNISRHLANIEICYANRRLTMSKNTFLLAILQNRLTYNCVFFDITLSNALSELPFCISAMYFLHQAAQLPTH